MLTTFKADLRTGQKLEKVVKQKLEAKGFTVSVSQGYNPSYDLCATTGRTSVFIEVKYDRKVDQTGNYALEARALTHSKSDILVIGTPKELWYLPMDKARELMNQYPQVQAGDMDNNPTALVPKNILISNAKRL